MSRTLHCLGTAGYHPNDRRQTSCYFLPEDGILVDAGSGLYRVSPLIKTQRLHILLSHAHLDHVLGITYLWSVIRLAKVSQVIVWGEADKLAAIAEHIFHPLIFPIMPQIQWRELPASRNFEIESTQVEWFALPHPGGAVGYKFTWQDTSLAYITDTTSTVASDFWPSVKDVNLLLHECNFRGEHAEFARQTGHSDLDSVVAALKTYKVRKTLLTHVDTTDDDLQTSVDQKIKEDPSLAGRISVASDGQIIKF